MAFAVSPSVPGARPNPKSIRLGYNDPKVPNCSATSNGEWFGNIIPPEPMRSFVVPCAT